MSALLSENTRFLLIGAHALAYHVEARLTEDLDVLVEPTPDNAARVLRALQTFGFGGLIADAGELAVPDRVFMLGRKPWRIDILTGIDGVSSRPFPTPGLPAGAMTAGAFRPRFNDRD